MDTKNFAIGVLSITAVILLTGLLIISTQPQPAYASSMNSQGGDYILTTGQLQPNQEVLYVIDAGSKKMIVYGYDLSRKTITPSAPIDLSKLPGSGADADPAQQPQQGKTGRSRGRRR